LDPGAGVVKEIYSSPGLQSFCWATGDKLYLALQEPPPDERDKIFWEASVHTDGTLDGTPQQITRWAGFSFWDLSATSDGTRLAFVKSGSQADVYVGKVDARGRQIADVRRFTLNEHDDWPSAWTTNGEVLFYSDRDGHFDIFRQKPGSEQPETVLSSAEDKRQPEFSSDGKWLLFWKSGTPSGSTRQLMKINIADGTVSSLFVAPADAEFHCAVAKPLCVLAEPDVTGKQVRFSRFDIDGNRSQLTNLPWSGGGPLAWSLSADGFSIALADIHEPDTTIRTISNNQKRDYELTAMTVTGITNLDKSWLLTTSSLHGNEVIFLGRDGLMQRWWSSSSPLSAPIVSPDGHMIALGLVSQESNVWLLEQK
jgi:Tol biopolymer transport system component